MRKRGPKSVAELLISEGPNGVIAQRPPAPYNLTDAEVVEWDAIVNAMVPGYFSRSHYPLLVQLCRHIVSSNRIAQLTEATCRSKKLDQSKLASLQAMQSSESSTIIRLSRSLRLSPQAIYRAEHVKARPVNHQLIEAPWNRGKPDDDED